MAVAFTKTKNTVYGTDRVVYGTLVFSSNYATGGEAVTAATFGLSRLDMLVFDGLAIATDGATANGVKYKASSATGGNIFQYEAAATGLALLEKTNGEAYATGSNVSCIAIGA